MRNSDKFDRVHRRRISLNQAIDQGKSETTIARLAERLRGAILVALKKERVRLKGNYVQDKSEYFVDELEKLEFAEVSWMETADEELVAIAIQWPEALSIRDLTPKTKRSLGEPGC